MIGILSFKFLYLDFMFCSENTYLQFACPASITFVNTLGLSMAGGRRILPAVIASHFRQRSDLAASGYCVQMEMNLDPLGLGVFTTHFKNFISENLDLHFCCVVPKAVSSALRLAPTFLSPRST